MFNNAVLKQFKRFLSDGNKLPFLLLDNYFDEFSFSFHESEVICYVYGRPPETWFYMGTGSKLVTLVFFFKLVLLSVHEETRQ